MQEYYKIKAIFSYGGFEFEAREKQRAKEGKKTQKRGEGWGRRES